MHLIGHYEIELNNSQPVNARILYLNEGKIHASNLQTLEMLNAIIQNWREDTLQGSFGIGTVLSPTATFKLFQSQN